MNDPFKLSWVYTPYPNGHGPYARLVDFPKSGNVVAWIHTRRVEVPEPVYFTAYLEEMDKECPDFPSNNQRWPIMSRRMLDALLSVAPFAHRAIPVALIDDYDLAAGENPYGDDWRPLPGAVREGYCAVQLLEHTEAIDWEQSRYAPLRGYENDPEVSWDLLKVVLAAPTTGFPPLFRLARSSAALFVSEVARDALVQAGLKGPDFIPMSKAIPGSVDVPPEWRHKRA